MVRPCYLWGCQRTNGRVPKLFEGARVSQIALEGAGDALYALSGNDGKRQEELQMAFNYYIQCSSSTKSAISVKGMNCLAKAAIMVLLDNIQITPEACEVLKIYSSLLQKLVAQASLNGGDNAAAAFSTLIGTFQTIPW